MERRDEKDLRPGPVLATFTRVVLRDAIITKKSSLHKMPDMDKIFINADEPLHIRRAKAILRKAAYLARINGDKVESKHDRIMINDRLYTTDTVSSIPSKYLSTAPTVIKPSTRDIAGASGMENEAEMPDSNVEKDENRKFTILPGENMHVCKKGLLFSGPNAFPSNLAKVPVRYQDHDYNSNEQAYQWLKASDHNQDDIAATIMTCTETWDIMYAGSDIEASEEWNRQSPNLLAELVIAKYEQNPELRERLISTYPMRLIEASISKKWGGGAPILLEIYDSDKPIPRKNIFGI